MWWQKLSVLDALAAHGSMTAAARHLGVNKATVSRHVAELEAEAPADLFERRNAGVSLTPYGERALAAFREHEKAMQRLHARLEPTELDGRGVVRVTVPSFLACELIVPQLPTFLMHHPQLVVEVDASSAMRDVSRGEADVALRDRRPREGSLAFRRVGQLGMAMYASRSYLERRGPLKAERDLRGHDFISYDSGCYAGPGFEWLPDALHGVPVVFAANDAKALHAAAGAGLGVAVLPQLLAEADRKLVRLEEAGRGLADIYLVTRAETRGVRRVREVVRFVTEVIRNARQRLVPEV